MMLLLQSTASSDFVPRPFVGSVRFELDLQPPMSVIVSVLGLAVLVGTWAAGAV